MHDQIIYYYSTDGLNSTQNITGTLLRSICTFKSGNMQANTSNLLDIYVTLKMLEIQLNIISPLPSLFNAFTISLSIFSKLIIYFLYCLLRRKGKGKPNKISRETPKKDLAINGCTINWFLREKWH